MYFEIFLIPFLIFVALFVIFFIVSEGSRWQKHKVLGPFARIVQHSPFVGFLIFFIMALLVIPMSLLVLLGYWMDAVAANAIPTNQSPVVNTLLVIMLLLSGMIPVMWSHFRQWRQAVRSMAEVRVRSI
ncbi:MAG: hypothetical protein K9W43_13405 [Candidatus Thorarchaeota archaeon]|nr:hypothetical protein [Candidatus Thorarchaeota archaeon]